MPTITWILLLMIATVCEKLAPSTAKEEGSSRSWSGYICLPKSFEIWHGIQKSVERKKNLVLASASNYEGRLASFQRFSQI